MSYRTFALAFVALLSGCAPQAAPEAASPPAVGSTTAAAANPTPPPLYDTLPDGAWDSVRNESAINFTGVRLGALDVLLEKTTLAQVRAAVGAGTVESQGDAGAFLAWLCYALPNNARIWFASGELGGGENITSVIVSANSSVSCPALPSALTSLGIDHGLRLGAPKADIIRAFGEAKAVDGIDLYAHDRQVATPNGPFDESTTLMVKYDHGAVEGFAISKITAG